MVLLPVDDRRCSCSREEAVHRVTVVKEEAVVAAEEAEAVVEVVVEVVIPATQVTVGDRVVRVDQEDPTLTVVMATAQVTTQVTQEDMGAAVEVLVAQEAALTLVEVVRTVEVLAEEVMAAIAAEAAPADTTVRQTMTPKLPRLRNPSQRMLRRHQHQLRSWRMLRCHPFHHRPLRQTSRHWLRRGQPMLRHSHPRHLLRKWLVFAGAVATIVVLA